MLDITTRAKPGASDLAKVRMAYAKAGLGADVADAILAATDPETAAETVSGIKIALTDLEAALANLTDANDVARAALAELVAIVEDDATTSDNLIPKAFARAAALRAEAAQKTSTPASFAAPRAQWNAGRSHDERHNRRIHMTAGLTKRLDPAAADAIGYRGEAFTVTEIAMACARAAGLRPVNAAEAITMAAHSTSDFPLILDGAVSNLVARKIALAPPAIQRAAHVVTRIDYRAGRNLSLSATSMPSEIREGGEIKFVTASESGELLPTVRDFGSGFNITNQAMVNDSTATGLLNDIGSKMADGALGRLRTVLLEPLLANSGAGQTMADGQPMFHTSHGNLATSPATIDVTSLSAARTAMRRRTGLQGEILAVEPWALVVPPELETVAEQVLAELAAAQVSEVNPFSGKLELIVEPGLTDDAAWYLCADPSRYDGLAYAFLEGQTAPRVESRPAWSTLGLELRLTWAMDAKFVSHTTWYRNAGA